MSISLTSPPATKDLELISSTTTTPAAASMTITIPARKMVWVVVYAAACSADTEIRMTVNADGGANYYGSSNYTSGGAAGVVDVNGATYVRIGSLSAADGGGFSIYLINPSTAADDKIVLSHSANPAGRLNWLSAFGYRGAAKATGITLTCSAGTLNAPVRVDIWAHKDMA